MAKYDATYWRRVLGRTEPRALMGSLRRLVENQEQKVTLSLTDSLAERYAFGQELIVEAAALAQRDIPAHILDVEALRIDAPEVARRLRALDPQALAARLDLMNRRAEVVDSWRRIEVAAETLPKFADEAFRRQLPASRPPGPPEIQQGHDCPLFNVALSSAPGGTAHRREFLTSPRHRALLSPSNAHRGALM